jgi:hypothetical protein
MDGDNVDMTNRDTWKAAYQGHNGGNNLREAQLYILAE